MEAKEIILTISLTVNFFALGIILILWFRKCKECGREKEICKSFSKICDKCEKKGNGDNANGKQRKNYETL